MRLAVPLELDPAALVGWRQGAPIGELVGETMGTTWRIRLAVPERFDGPALSAAIEARLDAILAEMSHWRADSVLGRFNRAAGGTWIVLPIDFATVLEAAMLVADKTGRAFDPAIGALVNVWGHGPDGPQEPPDESAIASNRARSGLQRLAYDATSHRLRQPGALHLDLSGIAKGFAVDALGAVLRAHECRHALVEIGGELLGLGLRPDGDPWWVELETPVASIAPFRVALHQLAVATSGDYVRGRHTIDPRTGRPVEHAVAVSVIHASAMLADAWATALGVIDPREMADMAERERLSVRALIRSGDGVTEWISPALSALL